MQVVVRQISGLGNQLFQYAAGLYFSRRYTASLRMATDLPQNALSHGFARPFLLSRFNIPIAMQSLSTEERLLFSVRPVLQPAVAALKLARGIQTFAEPLHLRYTFFADLPVAKSTKLLYLSGYWQAWRFADDVADTLRQELTLKDAPGAATARVFEQIARTANPVSLHIRRGDYTLAVEGNRALTLAYYSVAMRYVSERVADPTFFVFSDDIPWARANLPAGWRYVFVDHNDDTTSHEDLVLMSACHHHIIANSSFSWWGGWLNPRPDKIVYAPRNWHLRENTHFPQLIPPPWVIEPIEPAAPAG